MNRRTLLIGLDGATFTVLNPLMESGVMPFLKSFLANGVSAPLRTIIPALTPPAWTSLVTGRTPGQHGVFDFFRMESPESRQIRFFTAHDIGVDTLWTLVSAQGKRATVLNFPATFPAPKIEGHVVPGWIPWRQMRIACWPEDLWGRLKALPEFNTQDLALNIEIEAKATEGIASEEEYKPWIELHIRREQNWVRILRHLMKNEPSELTAILFDGVDKLQHLVWRFLRPEDARPLTQPWEFEIREMSLNYFRELDMLLAEMCEMAGPETTVVMASDHGFQATYEVFHVNAWLAEKGYLAWSEAGLAWKTEGATLGVNNVARHTWMLDWTKTKAFAATPTANGIYIVVSPDGVQPGVPKEQYNEFRARLIQELQSVQDPSTGERIVSQVWTRDDVFQGPYAEFSPDLTLVMRDGGLISILPSDQPVRKREEVAGAHHPSGFFAARGPGIRHGQRLDELSILDVAPTVLYTLGLPVPASLQGTVPETLFEAGTLQARPVATVSAPQSQQPADDTAPLPLDAEAEQVLMDRLRELGYIE